MGYTVVRTVYKLAFEDHPGMVVRAKGASVEGFTETIGLSSAVQDMDTENLKAGDAEKTVKAISDLFRRFADVLLDWNLEEEDGSAIPATVAGLQSLEFPFALEIIMAWVNTVSDVPAPLANSSTPGEMQGVAASLQMENLPSNPLNSLVPS
jgi:hypothetical protein